MPLSRKMVTRKADLTSVDTPLQQTERHRSACFGKHTWVGWKHINDWLRRFCRHQLRRSSRLLLKLLGRKNCPRHVLLLVRTEARGPNYLCLQRPNAGSDCPGGIRIIGFLSDTRSHSRQRLVLVLAIGGAGRRQARDLNTPLLTIQERAPANGTASRFAH
mmetsp:Transcript_32633/g.76487  ORF Transcript_32633/g.76487 Transcript_32633/m.76487 type:complete len:161 (-) Transcript_32633:798-1280(-)